MMKRLNLLQEINMIHPILKFGWYQQSKYLYIKIFVYSFILKKKKKKKITYNNNFIIIIIIIYSCNNIFNFKIQKKKEFIRIFGIFINYES